jgi:transposase-like protein
MSNNRQKFDEEFKKNAVRLSYASNKKVQAVADDLGIAVSQMYHVSVEKAVYTSRRQDAVCNEGRRKPCAAA